MSSFKLMLTGATRNLSRSDLFSVVDGHLLKIASMADNTETKRDFVTKTKGQCFFCSKNISFHYSTTKQFDSTSIHSLHCLASYLKIDMGKVFTGNEPIAAPLVERVKKSRLKAELCGECAVLNKKFSKIFRQLEKMEMEATFCVDIIHEKLKKGVTLERAQTWNDTSNPNDDAWIAKLEIAEALRKDTMHKCFRKLGKILPLTRIERLTRQQIHAEIGKIDLGKAAEGNQQSDLYYGTNYEHDHDIGGSPASLPALQEDDDDLSDLGKNYILGGDVKVENGSEGSSSRAATTVSSKNGRKPKLNSIEKEQLSRAIPTPIITASKRVEIDEKPEMIKNPETGLYKCPICFKEYVYTRDFRRHFKSTHLKVRYTCEMCKKDFSQKIGYERHYLSIHMGVRFKCGKCNKMFSREKLLKRHQKLSH